MLKPATEKAINPAQILSVGELTRRIKLLLEDTIQEVWIRGEVSNLRRQTSGHVYFTLKDAESQIPCVLFRAQALRCGVDLRDGQQLLAFGQVSVYEPRGAYQLIARVVMEDGVGRLRQEFEKLKAKLAAEGLFAPDRKRPLPTNPRAVGFITSPGGAAVHDFISILRRRGWSGRLVILPAKVQGREAAAEMAAQLAGAARLGIFELLVIGRGGGSLEDLWAFNEEILVRAVAGCPIPVISAVGHETDFSLCDFAADRRAETPSAAAELISSAFIEQSDRLTAAAETLRAFAETALERRRARLDLYTHRWRAASPQNFIENASLRLDDLAARAQSALSEHWQTHRESLHGVTTRLAALSPVARVSVENARTGNLSGRLTFLAANALKPRRMALENLGRRLEEIGVTRVLARGFVVLTDTEGKPIARRAQLTPGQHVRARFADGVAGLVTEDVSINLACNPLK